MSSAAIFVWHFMGLQESALTEVMGHFCPFPVCTVRYFGVIPLWSSHLGPVSGVGHFNPISGGHLGLIFSQTVLLDNIEVFSYLIFIV